MKANNLTGAAPDKDSWRTPPDLFRFADETMHYLFGVSITLDAAATAENALAASFFDAEADALKQDWRKASNGGAVFLNPPFSLISRFMAKVHEESKRGVVAFVISPGTWSTKWAHRHLLGSDGASHILVPDRRVRYLRPTGELADSPQFETIFSIWSPSTKGRPELWPVRIGPRGWCFSGHEYGT